MENKKDSKIVKPEDFVELLNTCFSDDGNTCVFLRVTGNSMLPFFSDKRDTVFLSCPDEKLKKGDIALFKRSNGQVVLHRIVKVENSSYYFLGDGQITCEGPVKRENILAVCKSAQRKGRMITEKSPVWQFYKHIWIHMVPVRIQIINAVGRIKKKI